MASLSVCRSDAGHQTGLLDVEVLGGALRRGRAHPGGAAGRRSPASTSSSSTGTLEELRPDRRLCSDDLEEARPRARRASLAQLVDADRRGDRGPRHRGTRSTWTWPAWRSRSRRRSLGPGREDDLQRRDDRPARPLRRRVERRLELDMALDLSQLSASPELVSNLRELPERTLQRPRANAARNAPLGHVPGSDTP